MTQQFDLTTKEGVRAWMRDVSDQLAELRATQVDLAALVTQLVEHLAPPKPKPEKQTLLGKKIHRIPARVMDTKYMLPGARLFGGVILDVQYDRLADEYAMEVDHEA